MDLFFEWLDRLLIPLFRIVPNPVAGFFLGVFLLAIVTVVLGEFTISLAFRWNRRHIKTLNENLAREHQLSIDAAKTGDKKLWKVMNRRANDAFGKQFFAQFAMGVASLWPVFFALAFLQNRFAHIEFPLPFEGLGFRGGTVNYFTIFLLEYILARILFGKVKRFIPYFRNMQALIDEVHSGFRETERQLRDENADTDQNGQKKPGGSNGKMES